MYHVSAQGIDERMINVHYYYYSNVTLRSQSQLPGAVSESGGGRPGLSAPNKPCCFCARKATLKKREKSPH